VERRWKGKEEERVKQTGDAEEMKKSVLISQRKKTTIRFRGSVFYYFRKPSRDAVYGKKTN